MSPISAERLESGGGGRVFDIGRRHERASSRGIARRYHSAASATALAVAASSLGSLIRRTLLPMTPSDLEMWALRKLEGDQ